jgi:AraC-like DNA-binding protein
MYAETLRPHPSLLPWISHFFALEGEGPATGFILPLIANGFPSLIFQTSDQAWIPGEDRCMPALSLHGQYVAPIPLALRGRFTLMACFFRPHALGPLFGLDAAGLTGARIDLDSIEPAGSRLLRERLSEARSRDTRADLMQAFVRERRVRRPSAGNGMAAYATRVILESGGSIGPGTLQDRLRTTERSLQRIFAADVGISPRLFARICRFQSAFRRLNEGRFSTLGDLAHDAGYADQSHFLRAFKEFAGMGPKEYLKKLADLRQ